MSHFSEALRGALAQANIVAFRVAQHAGLASSTIDGYLNARSAPKPDALAKILAALPDDCHAALIIARVRDEIPLGYETVINLAAQTGPIAESRPPYNLTAELSGDLQAALDYILSEAVRRRDTDIRDLLIDLSYALGRPRL
jgi:transcriptional regulator with XRE-family HTH domain